MEQISTISSDEKFIVGSRKAAKEPVPAPGVEIEKSAGICFPRKDRKIPFHA